MAMEIIVEKKDNVGLWMNIIDEMQSYYDQRAPIYDESMGYTESDKLASLQPVIEFIGA